MHACLDFRVRLASRHGLGAQKKQTSAVERGKGKQVERTEVAR